MEEKKAAKLEQAQRVLEEKKAAKLEQEREREEENKRLREERKAVKLEKEVCLKSSMRIGDMINRRAINF